MKRSIMCVLFILLISISLSGLVVYNHLETVYNGGNETARSSDSRIKTMIVMGGGYFLEAHSGFQSLLSQVELGELQGMDYQGMRAKLNGVISALDSADLTYNELKNLAAVTPYNRTVILGLKTFDYNGFAKKRGLNSAIFSRVEHLLKKGRVTELFRNMAAGTGKISALLRRVKKSLDNNLSPDINLLWRINQLFADSYLSGQYAAMVLKSIEK